MTGVQTCALPILDEVPAFIRDKQESSGRGAARTALALVHARNPDVDLELCTAGVPPGSKSKVLMAKVRGLDNRVVKMINHDAFYDKEKLAPELRKREAERLRLAECRLKEELDSDAEDFEEYSEEADPKEAGTSTSPNEENTPEGSGHSVSSPSKQASPTKTVSQEE